MNDLPEDALEVFLEAFITGDTSQAILNQEKRGQMQQAHRETLPRDMGNYSDAFEALGFVLGEPVDDLFIEATFPDGWKKEPTDHSMHTHIVDDQGRVRGNIFYKAAFYDRSANASLYRRYSYNTLPLNGYGPDFRWDEATEWVGVVIDNASGERIWQSDHEVYKSGEGYEKDRMLSQIAKAWLVQFYPDYENVLAYWAE